MQQEAGYWQQASRERESKRKTGAKRLNRWQIILLISYLLVAIACWSILSIYAPVLAAEVTYQAKSRGWSRILFPRISLDLVPQTLASGYGLVIPKIFVTEPIIPEVDPADPRIYKAALNRGIAQAKGTGMPGDGNLGYYFAHSSGMNVLAPQKKAVFYLLGKLQIGDEIHIYKQHVKYTYRVVRKDIVNPTDLGFLNRQREREQIVLQTCWPIGTSLQRLLVTAEII